MWQECKRCNKKILVLKGRPVPHEGYCATCYEIETGKCAECEGKGTISRAHLGTMECSRCEGSGKANR